MVPLRDEPSTACSGPYCLARKGRGSPVNDARTKEPLLHFSHVTSPQGAPEPRSSRSEMSPDMPTPALLPARAGRALAAALEKSLGRSALPFHAAARWPLEPRTPRSDNEPYRNCSNVKCRFAGRRSLIGIAQPLGPTTTAPPSVPREGRRSLMSKPLPGPHTYCSGDNTASAVAGARTPSLSDNEPPSGCSGVNYRVRPVVESLLACSIKETLTRCSTLYPRKGWGEPMGCCSKAEPSGGCSPR